MPTRGVLPPLLWCLVVNELITELNVKNFQTEAFSDDLGKFINVLCDLLQTALNIVTNWCDKNELNVNPEKTKMIIFTRKRKIDGIRIPKIKGIPIKLVYQLKYLGIILDHRLNWEANLDSRITIATISLWQCRKAYGSRWGLLPKVMFWIYTTVIRPVLTYGCFLWSHICKNKRIQTKLNKFQRMACRAITSAWKSTPTAALEAILNLTPLHILIESLAISTLDRMALQQTNTSHITNMTQTWIKTKVELPSLSMPSDKIITSYRFNRKFDIYIPPKQDWFNGILPPENEIVIYTDGSLLNNSAGAGVFCDKLNIELPIPLGHFPSVYMAEVRAILESCYIILNMDITNELIFICSDSQAAMKALSSVTFKSALTLECWETLNSLALKNRVDVIWVPSHSNIPGNEKADELARLGASITPIGPEPILGTPYSHNKRLLNDLRESKFIYYWQRLTNCRQAKECVRISKKESKYLINVSRTRLKTYIGVVTGHFYFNKHMATIGRSSDTSCDLCGEHMDTAEHFLCNCPAFITSRRKHLGGYIIRYNLIRSLQSKDILNYITSTGRFQQTANV